MIWWEKPIKGIADQMKMMTTTIICIRLGIMCIVHPDPAQAFLCLYVQLYPPHIGLASINLLAVLPSA